MPETNEPVMSEDKMPRVLATDSEVDDVPGVHVQVGEHDAQMQNPHEESANE